MIIAFKHSTGLSALFLTEMWERFSYYGMRAILILFLIDSERNGGLALDDRQASSVYGLYIAGTYVLAILGGWVADRFTGARVAVVCGGALILIGNILLAVSPSGKIFALGLIVIVTGVGLLKPNISVMVARLYPQGGAVRDAGFSIFYVGINIGALLGSILVPLCAARLGWRWGFLLPAGGMLLGLVQFLATPRSLSDVQIRADCASRVSSSLLGISVCLLPAAAAAITLMSGVIIIPSAMISAASWAIGILAGAYFVYLIKWLFVYPSG